MLLISTSAPSLKPAAARKPALPQAGRLPIGFSAVIIAGLSAGLWAAIFHAVRALALL